MYFTKGSQKKVAHPLEWSDINSKNIPVISEGNLTRIQQVLGLARHFAHFVSLYYIFHCMFFKHEIIMAGRAVNVENSTLGGLVTTANFLPATSTDTGPLALHCIFVNNPFIHSCYICSYVSLTPQVSQNPYLQSR